MCCLNSKYVGSWNPYFYAKCLLLSFEFSSFLSFLGAETEFFGEVSIFRWEIPILAGEIPISIGSGWWFGRFLIFPFHIMGCHPKPIDELISFKMGTLHHQGLLWTWDGMAVEMPKSPAGRGGWSRKGMVRWLRLVGHPNAGMPPRGALQVMPWLWIRRDVHGNYPLVMTDIAIENGHL